MTIKFPIDPSILWDRTPLHHSPLPSSSIICKNADICCYLILISSDIEKLLETFIGEEGNTVDFPAHLTHIIDAPIEYRRGLENSPHENSCKYSLYMSDVSKVDSGLTTITIPIKSTHFHDNGAFSNSSLLPNARAQLEKAIKQSRSFALKNFVRVYGIGKALKMSGYNTISLMGSIKFESLVPDFTIQCVPIKPIQALSTPLSSLLFSLAPQMNPIELAAIPHFGYLTLNQTRKVVFLQEQDPAVSIVPTIGVWIRLEIGSYRNPLQNFEEIANDLIYHPLCWAASLRFIQNDNLLKQHVLNQNTFLLIILCDGYIQYFEITPVTKEKTGSYLPIRTLQDFQLSFVEFDFTANLNVEKPSQEIQRSYFEAHEGGKSIVCKFKVIPKFYNNHDHRAIGHAENLNLKQELLFEETTDMSMLESPQIVGEARRTKNIENSEDTVDAEIPHPRTVQSLPLPVSSPTKPSNPPVVSFPQEIPVDDVKPFQESQEFSHMNNSVLVQVVLDQHQEIKKLKDYIHTLRKIISDLGGEYPDLYVEEIAQLKKEEEEENTQTSKKDEFSSILREEKSVNLIEFVDNSIQHRSSIEHLEIDPSNDINTNESDENGEDMILKYLTSDEIQEIQNFADIDVNDEETSGLDERSSTLLTPNKSARLLKKSATTFSALSSPVKSSPMKTVPPGKFGPVNISSIKSPYVTHQKSMASLQNAKLLMEMPSQICETESILKIQSQYL